MNAFEIAQITEGRADLCKEILHDLPDWFGISESNAAFIAGSSTLPMFAAYVRGQCVGIVSLKQHTNFAVELYVMGVKRKFHHQGVGRALIESAVNFADREGFSFLTVKTLAASVPDRHYAATRSFYEAVGFLPIEVFPNLWNARNHCLLMLKPIRAAVGG